LSAAAAAAAAAQAGYRTLTTDLLELQRLAMLGIIDPPLDILTTCDPLCQLIL